MPDDDKKLKFETRYLNEPASGQYLQPRLTGPLDGRLPGVLEFRVAGTSAVIQTQLRETMIIGREDPDSRLYPEIDLAPFNAYARGVSRSHAAILARDGRVTVKDLKSANGTRLNGFRLIPETEYRLKHGDELSLGQLRLQVLFSIIPAHWSGDTAENAGELRVPVVGGGQRVLVVASDEDVAAVFRVALDRSGFHTTAVKTASQAEHEIQSRPAGAVVIDVALPGLDGLDLVRNLRRAVPSEVPILVISGAGGLPMNKALEAGARMFLAKPVSIDELVRAVSASIGNES